MYNLVAALVLSATPPTATGHLVIVGGGRTPPNVAHTILELAGGPQARVVVIPYASRRPDAATRSRGFWQNAGAKDVYVADDTQDRATILRALHDADLIWLPGGSQTRLMARLQERGLIHAIRERFEHGATVAGTSAGAAVMSQIMLAWSRHGPILGQGLGLWPDVIVDQHFLRRHRLARLREAVLEHPDKVGVGIDEGTAVVVAGSHFEVLGRSVVTVLDARQLAFREHAKTLTSKTPVPEYTLQPGMTFDLQRLTPRHTSDNTALHTAP